jgi:hypothetical protein
MKDLYRLHGFASATDSVPSFATPVFKKGELYYVQIIGGDESIEGFEEVESFDYYCHEERSSKDYVSGDKAIYAVRDRFNLHTVVTRSDLEQYLRRKLEYYVHVPFFYRTASEISNRQLPEYLGCNTARDFLVRQIVSHSVREFSVVWQKQFWKGQPWVDVPRQPLNKMLIHGAKAQPHKRSKMYPNMRDLYARFIEFATARNKKIADEKVVMESLQVSKYVLPSYPVVDRVKVSQARNYLIKMLESDRSSEVRGDHQLYYLRVESKTVDGVSRLDNDYKDFDLKSKRNAIALIIFVTTVFSQISDE